MILDSLDNLYILILRSLPKTKPATKHFEVILKNKNLDQVNSFQGMIFLRLYFSSKHAHLSKNGII